MSESEIRKLSEQIAEWDSEKAFREFYYLCYDRFFRIAYYYVKNDSWAQEIVIDCFVKLWEKRFTLSQVSNLEDYCFILVKNTSLNFLEKETRMEKTPLAADTIHEADYSPEETLISEEIFAEYVKALDKLPPRCREVFIKVKEEKLSYAQVAAEMNISVKTVDAQVQKAMAQLRTALAIHL